MGGSFVYLINSSLHHNQRMACRVSVRTYVPICKNSDFEGEGGEGRCKKLNKCIGMVGKIESNLSDTNKGKGNTSKSSQTNTCYFCPMHSENL